MPMCKVADFAVFQLVRRLYARLFGLRRRCSRRPVFDFSVEGERAAIAALTFRGGHSR